MKMDRVPTECNVDASVIAWSIIKFEQRLVSQVQGVLAQQSLNLFTALVNFSVDHSVVPFRMAGAGVHCDDHRCWRRLFQQRTQHVTHVGATGRAEDRIEVVDLFTVPDLKAGHFVAAVAA